MIMTHENHAFCAIFHQSSGLTPTDLVMCQKKLVQEIVDTNVRILCEILPDHL
jgi:hypothetical protein